MSKKSKEDEKTSEELNSAHRRSQAKRQYKPVTLNELNCSCLCRIINILLTELSRSVWKNLDLGRVYRTHCVRSVLTNSVKILPYRPTISSVNKSIDHHLLPWVSEVLFFSLEAKEKYIILQQRHQLNNESPRTFEAAKASREVARKNYYVLTK